MHSKSNNIEIMINNEADEVIKELSKQLSELSKQFRIDET